mmetsp:Transcript_19954/g.22989  ORF Transcript_19954/g.22989 Transcript_19954/m.22989 type:complete len:810 (+) Transcript_19954:750-3179(+)
MPPHLHPQPLGSPPPPHHLPHQPPPFASATGSSASNPPNKNTVMNGQGPTAKPPASPWSEHTAPSGQKYYYNGETKESTYTKPKQLTLAATSSASASEAASPKKTKATVSAAANNTPTKNRQHGPWREYTDEKTGVKYYHNSESKESTYTKPKGFGEEEPEEPKQPEPLIKQQPAPLKSTPWKEYTDPKTKVKYYHNSDTKESTYNKPPELEIGNNSTASSLDTSNHKRTATQTHTHQTTPQKLKKSNQESSPKKDTTPKWKEYTDPNSGKTFYSDGTNSSWTAPPGFEDTSTTSSPKSTKSKKHNARKLNNSGAKKYSTKEEASIAFKGMLLARGITPTTKWSEVAKTCGSDPKWTACETVGERKQALAEYQTKRAVEVREERRQEILRAKEQFRKLLAEQLSDVISTRAKEDGAGGGSSAPNAINTPLRFHERRDKLSRDDRFYGIEEEEVREELFYDFVEDMRKREERIARAKKKAAKDGFMSFLKEREDKGTLLFSSTWASFRASLSDKDMADKRFTVSEMMSDLDRQVFFADYVTELQAVEDEKRRRIRDARRRAEKAQRDAYRDLLRKCAREGAVGLSTRGWRTVWETLKEEESYQAVYTQDREAPRVIYEDFVEDLREAYREDGRFLNNLSHANKGAHHHRHHHHHHGHNRANGAGRGSTVEVRVDTTYEEFCKALLVSATTSESTTELRRVLNREPVSSARIFFHELKLRAKNVAAVSTSATNGFRRHSTVVKKEDGEEANDDGDEDSDDGEIIEDGELREDDQQEPENSNHTNSMMSSSKRHANPDMVLSASSKRIRSSI